jgi:hypothetical protein
MAVTLAPSPVRVPRLVGWRMAFCDVCGTNRRPLARIAPGWSLARTPAPSTLIELDCRNCHTKWYVVPRTQTG